MFVHADLLFELTPAEIRLVHELVIGSELQVIAQSLNRTVDTLRSQPKSILTKTKTHQQSELLRLMTQLGMIRE